MITDPVRFCFQCHKSQPRATFRFVGATRNRQVCAECYEKWVQRKQTVKVKVKEGVALAGLKLDTYVWAQLTNWSAWRRSTIKAGPPQLKSWWWPIVMRGNVQQIGRDWDKEVYDELSAMATEKAVSALPHYLRVAVFERYINRGTCKQQCEALGYSERTLQGRLDEANTLLLGLMNDIAAGVDPHV